MPEAITWSSLNKPGYSFLSPGFKSQDRVFTAGQIGTDAANKIPNDVAQQTELVIANLKDVLEKAGSGLDKVVKVLLFIKNPSDAAVVNEIYAKHFTSRPARSCIVVDFPMPDLLVEIEVVASTVAPEEVSYEAIGEKNGFPLLSPAFKTQGLVYTSGQVGSGADGKLAEDVTQQAENAIQNVAKVLEASGSSLDRSLKVLLFISDGKYADEVNKVYGKYFTSLPGRSCIIVQFPNPNIKVELEVIAEYGPQTSQVTSWDHINKSGNKLLQPGYKANGLVITSGQTGNDDSGLPDDVTQQTENCIKNAIEVLEKSGTTLDKSLKTLLFIKNRSVAAAVNEVYSKYFTTAPPGRSCVIVDFPNPKLLVEIEVIAQAGDVSTKL